MYSKRLLDKFYTVLHATLKNGGGTFTSRTLTSRDYTSGYSVAVKQYEKMLPLEDMNPGLLEEYINHAKELREELRAKGIMQAVNIGTWINNDILYLDISIYELDLVQAVKLGLEHEQIAIYDFGNNTTIEIDKLKQAFN